MGLSFGMRSTSLLPNSVTSWSCRFSTKLTLASRYPKVSKRSRRS